MLTFGRNTVGPVCRHASDVTITEIMFQFRFNLKRFIYQSLTDGWHMILSQRTVELFNWKTGEQCKYPELDDEITDISGTVFGDVPVYCGGDTINCFKFVKETKTLEKVRFH